MRLYSVRDTKDSQLNARALIKVPTDSEWNNTKRSSKVITILSFTTAVVRSWWDLGRKRTRKQVSYY